MRRRRRKRRKRKRKRRKRMRSEERRRVILFIAAVQLWFTSQEGTARNSSMCVISHT